MINWIDVEDEEAPRGIQLLFAYWTADEVYVGEIDPDSGELYTGDNGPKGGMTHWAFINLPKVTFSS